MGQLVAILFTDGRNTGEELAIYGLGGPARRPELHIRFESHDPIHFVDTGRQEIRQRRESRHAERVRQRVGERDRASCSLAAVRIARCKYIGDRSNGIAAPGGGMSRQRVGQPPATALTRRKHGDRHRGPPRRGMRPLIAGAKSRRDTILTRDAVNALDGEHFRNGRVVEIKVGEVVHWPALLLGCRPIRRRLAGRGRIPSCFRLEVCLPYTIDRHRVG